MRYLTRVFKKSTSRSLSRFRNLKDQRKFGLLSSKRCTDKPFAPKCSACSIPCARAVCRLYSKCTPGSGHPKLAMYIYALVPYPLLECIQLWKGIHTWHIGQCFETLPGGVRTSRLDWNLPDVSFYIPEVITEVYTRCTAHWGPPKVNRVAKVQVVVEIFKITSQWNASYMLEFMGSR